MNTQKTPKQPTSEEVTQNAAQNTTDGNETTSISEASKTETSETIPDEVKPNEDTNETNTPKDEISNMEQESKTNLKKEDIKINEKSEISDKEETKTNNKNEVTANLDEDNKENIDYKDKDEMCSNGNKESLEGKDSKEITKTNNESEVIALSKDDSEETTNSNISIAIAAKRKRSDSSKSFEQSDREEDNNNALNNTTSEMNDGEAEFEDVEIPDGEEELIVPDETGNAESEDEGIDGDKDSDKALIANAEEEEESKHTKSSEGEESNFSAIEPELVAIEESSKDDNNLDEEQQTANDDDSSNLTAYDPLNCLADQDATGSGGDSNGCEANSNANVEINMVSGESNDTGRDSNDASASNANKEDEDDDDEVQFVETRNSPICIESDEEDSNSNSQSNVAATASKRETRSRLSAKNNSEAGKQTINLPSATITVPKNLTVIRTSARKSTSRPQQYNNSPSTTVPQQQQHNKSKNFQYLQNATTYRRSMPPASRNVVDTIDLLDSSDDESNNGTSSRNKSLTHTFKTPPKRTLMAAKSVNKKSPNKMTFVGGFNNMPSNFAAQIRRQPKKPAPPPLPPPTPQSNFLNAVQLQPATGGASNNPPAFSALLSNKSVIIPNAFYGNPPALRGADLEKEKRYARWLDNFITQFCNPQLVASHSCFVFLQRALKYKDFVHIKNIRTGMNMQAQTAKEQINNKLMLELRATFLKNSKEITTHGRRFCELTCSMVDNKSVTLLVHGITSRVIMKTCNLEIPSSSSASSSATNTNSSTSSSSTTRKRHLDEDEDEYVPGKNKVKNFTSSSASLENTDHSSGDSEGPKRSLRSKRTKRIDNNFSYNEDDLAEYDLEDEEEQAERLAREAVQKKIDQKRLEAQRQRQQQAESFESAFLQTFAKGLDGRAPTSLPPARTAATNQRARVNNSGLSESSVVQHAMHNDAEDLLTATWIENVENEDTQIISDDDEPREHRIYKQQQQQHQQKQKHQRPQQIQRSSPKSSNLRHNLSYDADPRHWPKNTDISLYVNSKNKDICVICKLSVQRIVHHYVNEHRGCEVYNSRLSSLQLEHLRRGASSIVNVSIYKNGQPQYEAHCIFCQKNSRFMMPYWYQHFTMHTGEYSYRCSGCGVRKPTRSLLTQHQSQGCPQGGSVLQDYSPDVKKIRVEARICTLCNYVQLHRNNIVKHLHTQHNVKQILPKHIQTIILLKEQTNPPGPTMPAAADVTNLRRRHMHQQQSSSSAHHSNNNSYVVDDDEDDDNTLLFADDALPPLQQQQYTQQEEDEQVMESNQNQYYNYMPPYMMNQANQQNFTWADDPSDDLSFMICGMLDVQMNNSTTTE